MPRGNPRSIRRIIPALALCAVTVTSCGWGTADPRGVTQHFISSMQDQDWESACQVLSHDFVHRNMNGDSRYCYYYLEQWHADSTVFDGMEVPRQSTETGSDGTVITVDLADGSTDEARVVDEGGELRLARYPGQDTAAR